MRRRHALSAFCLGLLVVAPGCAAFRAQVGFGFGVGADVQVFGVHHLGAMLGTYHEFGPNYGRGYYCKTEHTVLANFHWTTMTFEDGREIKHGCFGMFPGPLGLLDDEEPPAERWAMEFGAGLTFLEIRMGFNPVAPFFEDDTPGETPPVGPQGPWKPDGKGYQPPATTASSDQPPPTYGGSSEPPASRTAPQQQPARGAPPPPPPPPTTACAACGSRVDVCGCPR